MCLYFNGDTPGAAVSKVLVVDDARDLVVIASCILRADGHEVLAARNGQEALEMVVAERPDAILLDVMMPGMDGIEVCRAAEGRPVSAQHSGHPRNRQDHG